METYLVAQIARAISGTSTDPNTLAQLSACFECLSPSVLKAIQDYLLCQIINVSGGSAPVTPSTLNNDLVAFWNLNEAAGSNRLDSKDSNTLVESGGLVTSVAGVIGNAAQFTAAGGQFLDGGDTADLSMGAGVTCTIALWVNVAVKTGGAGPFGKWTGNPGQREYHLFLTDHGGADKRWTFQVRATSDAANGTTEANTFGAIPLATWHFVMMYYDGANLGISVNNGAVDTVVYSGDIQNGPSSFMIGTSATGDPPLDCSVDLMGIWKRKLTAAEVTELYNGGLGKSCCPF